MAVDDRTYFKVKCKLGKTVRTSIDYWNAIIESKHPIIRRYEKEVKETLKEPVEVRKSKKDPSVYLYYRRYERYYVCVLAKHLDGEGFIITAYLSDNVKRGEIVWRRKSR